jgi:phosphatidylinositol alpha-1,6-mannosyltransferase
MTRSVVMATQTFPPRVGGMEMVMLSLAQYISKLGTPTYVVADRRWMETASFHFTSIWAPKILRSWAKRIYLTHHFGMSDIYICDSWKSIISLPKRAKHIIMLAHGQEYLNKQNKRPEIQRALDRCSVIICSSHATKKLLSDYLSAKWNGQIRVIPPTYMLEPPNQLVSKANDYGGVIRLLTVCRLEERKGIAHSMLALNEIKDKIPPFRWDIIGDGPERKKLEALRKSLDMNAHIQLHGFVDNPVKTDLLNQSDLFVMPSYQHGGSLEGFGIAYVEAAAYAIPSIAGVDGGAPEAVLDGKTGWCVKGQDVCDIRQALYMAITDHKERQKRGHEAKIRYNREFAASVTQELFRQSLQHFDGIHDEI